MAAGDTDPHDSPGAALPWKPGSRVARLRDTHSYRPVLGLIVLSFVFIAAAPPGAWSRSLLVLLQCATLITALRTAGLGRDHRLAYALVAISLAAAALELTADSHRMDGLVWLLEVLLVGATVAVIGLGMIDQGEVNRQSVLGAICVYLLLGMFFAFVYGALAALDSGPLFAQGTDGTPSIRLYFSYVTLATLGYGDFTPAGDLGRILSVAEALLGQLYLVTVVAVLVSHLGRRIRSSGD